MASIFCRYKDGTYQICNKTASFSDIKVNGVSIGVTTTYPYVNSTDIVEFILKDTNIGADAFYDCEKLTKVIIGDTVSSVGDRAFEYCDSLSFVYLPDTLTSIGEDAFNDCVSLGSIIIPDSVTTIGRYAFADCVSLTSIILPNSLTEIQNSTFYNCDSLSYVGIPDSVTTIGSGAFYDCDSLKSIVIPASVTTIGSLAFGVCESLVTIYCKGNQAPSLAQKDVFRKIASNGTLYYPSGSTYSKWLSNNEWYLGYYNWNGKQMNPEDMPDMPDNPNPPVDPDNPDIPDEPDIPDGPYVTGTTTILYFNYDGTPKTTNEFDVYWYGDYYDRNLVNDSSHFGVSGKKIETTDDYVKFHYTVNCPQNTTSEVITGSCYFNIKLDASTYGESFVVEFIQDANPEIPDPDEPDTPVDPDEPVNPDVPSIDLEYDKITAPQGGMNTTIDVETENVDDMQVIAPDWVDVIEKDGYYEIIIKPNEDGSDRTGEVIFIGNPSRPNRVQQNVIINQNSDNSEMAASISLEKNKITFDNTGYAENFGVKVTYTNAQEIYTPVCSEEWVTITELLPPQGGNTGGDTNATVKRYGFEVTETDVARTATVTFSCKGDTGRVISNSSFVVEQMGESAEETGVIVKAFTGAGSVNYDGSSTGISIDYLSCGYSNFASVLAPVVDVNWIHLGEGVLQSGYGYDEIYRYPISFDTNDGELRVGTVRFVATDEMGDEYTDTCTITQFAKPDEPETPEIPVEGDDYCGPIWKDIEYDFGSIDQIDYSVYKVEKQRVINTWVDVDVLIFKGRTCKRPTDVGNKILVNKICQNYMEPPFLGKGDIGAVGGYGVFKLKSENGSTTYRTYRFVNDWSYSTDFRTGALSHPILKDRKVAKNQLLPFTVFGNAEKVGVPYGIKYQEGYTDKYGKEVPDWNNTSYVINNVATEVFPNGDRGKGAKSYYIGDTEWEVVDDCTEYVLYYVNPWGGYDWFPIRAKIEEKDSITAYTYIQNYNNQTWEFGKRRYLSEITKRYTLHTQWMSEDESSRMWYLLQSNIIYLHNLKTNEIQPVVLTNTEHQHKKRLRGSRISYTIEVELSQHRERI